MSEQTKTKEELAKEINENFEKILDASHHNPDVFARIGNVKGLFQQMYDAK